MEQFLDQWIKLRETFPDIIALAVTIAAAFMILISGWIIARWVRRRLRSPRFGGHHIDPTLRPVIASSISYVIIAMTVYAFLTKLGVPPGSLLAVFGAAGLAIGLALKDTLSNIAAGVMLLVLRPLEVGEFIDTPNCVGTVEEINLFATTIKNSEGIYLYIPNSQVWNIRLQNFGRHTVRKFMTDIGVGYETDLRQAQSLLIEAMRSHPLVLNEIDGEPTPPEIYVMAFADSAITLSCRCWLPADVWQNSASEMRLLIKDTLDQAAIDIPFPQRVVTTKPS